MRLLSFFRKTENRMDKFAVLAKVERMYNSCETSEQYRMLAEYARLVAKRYPEISEQAEWWVFRASSSEIFEWRRELQRTMDYCYGRNVEVQIETETQICNGSDGYGREVWTDERSTTSESGCDSL